MFAYAVFFYLRKMLISNCIVSSTVQSCSGKSNCASLVNLYNIDIKAAYIGIPQCFLLFSYC